MPDGDKKKGSGGLERHSASGGRSALRQGRSVLRRMEVPSGLRDPASYRRFSLYQFVYSLSGLVLGLVCILGGVVLFLNGIVGTTSWTARLLGAESSVTDAAPGAVLFIVGLFMVYVTRFTIKVRR